MASSTPPSSKTYHHGDLRRALLDSAKMILAETGRWDFSLREVARRAGVSHNAPYRHFADKQALLEELAVSGYDSLRAIGAAAAEGITAPPALLAALGHAYVRFGTANPALYRLMFGQTLPHVENLSQPLLEAVTLARDVLRDVVLAGALDGSFKIDPVDVHAVGAAVVGAWSLVHGVTMLWIDDVIRRDTREEDIERVPTDVVEMFVNNLCNPPLRDNL